MQSVMDLRARWKDRFAEKHGVKLGFMSFFVKAVQTLVAIRELLESPEQLLLDL